MKLSIRRLRARRNEHGAIALLVAVLALSLFMAAGLAVDITKQVNKKQLLHDTLDAAAQAGAYDLPDSATQARADALSFAQANDATETGANVPNIDFWCIVAALPASQGGGVDTTQIPATCYPGTSPYTTTHYPGLVCSQILCAIPCPTGSAYQCNTIRVTQSKNVPFVFGPAGGIPSGGTGAVVSVACKGSCGTVAPNPMNVAVVADRTGSMSTSDINDMISGIKSMFQVMTPSQQYVALGTIGRASVSNTPSSEPGTSCPTSPSSSETSGAWISVPFSNNYQSGTNLNSSSALVKGVNCLTTHSSTGTALASPLKAAARYLLGYDSNNLGSLPSRSGTPEKVLIFETDGQPNESPNSTGSTAVNSTGDVFSNTGDSVVDGSPKVTYSNLSPKNCDTSATTGSKKCTSYTKTTTTTYMMDGGYQACQNLVNTAASAKANGILVITIAYNLSGVTCDSNDDNPPKDVSKTGTATKSNGITVTPVTVTHYEDYQGTSPSVISMMAAAASGTPGPTGSSTAQNSCSTSAQQATENSDGDFFFCAASGSDMASIFKTAFGQASSGIRLINMP